MTKGLASGPYGGIVSLTAHTTQLFWHDHCILLFTSHGLRRSLKVIIVLLNVTI